MFFFFLILHNERDQELHQHHVNNFSKTFRVCGKGVILGLKMLHSHISLMD